MIPFPIILGRQIDICIHGGVLEHVLLYTAPSAFMDDENDLELSLLYRSLLGNQGEATMVKGDYTATGNTIQQAITVYLPPRILVTSNQLCFINQNWNHCFGTI
jgi:hypothetical protein